MFYKYRYLKRCFLYKIPLYLLCWEWSAAARRCACCFCLTLKFTQIISLTSVFLHATDPAPLTQVSKWLWGPVTKPLGRGWEDLHMTIRQELGWAGPISQRVWTGVGTGCWRGTTRQTDFRGPSWRPAVMQVLMGQLPCQREQSLGKIMMLTYTIYTRINRNQFDGECSMGLKSTKCDASWHTIHADMNIT